MHFVHIADMLQIMNDYVLCTQNKKRIHWIRYEQINSPLESLLNKKKMASPTTNMWESMLK